MAENPFEQIKVQIDKLDKELDDYEIKLGLPIIEPEEILKTAVSIIDSLENPTKFSPDECRERASRLAQHCFFLQRAINKENSRIHWLDEQINNGIIKRIQQQVGSTHEERKLKAIFENENIKRMYDAKQILERRVLRTAYLVSKIESLRLAYSDLQRRSNV